MSTINFEGTEIEVDEIERVEWDFILYKSTHSEDYYIYFLKNISAAYYDKLVKIEQNDLSECLNNKITISELVKKYR